MNRARALQVSAASRTRAAVAMLVLGDAKAAKFRDVLWSKHGKQWSTSRATWAPSELTRLPAEAFDAVVDFGGRIRDAVAEEKITERKFRLDIASVVELVTNQDWTGPGNAPPWSKNVTISQPPPRTGYKEHPTYIGHQY